MSLHRRQSYLRVACCRLGLQVAVVLLMEAKDGYENDTTPLQMAYHDNYTPTLEVLLEGVSNIGVHHGFTAAYIAAEGGDPAVMEVLIRHKALM